MVFHVKKVSKVVASSVLAASLLIAPWYFSKNEVKSYAETIGNSEVSQQLFENVAKEFGVPVNVLMAVSYNESRWVQHEGHSEVGGFGIMNLVQADQDHSAKGDETAEGTYNTADEAIYTLDQAAQILKVNPDLLKDDPEQNIRGGAALLAEYAKETTGGLPSDAADWYGAVVKYSGSDIAELATDYADQVYETIQNGAVKSTHNGEKLTLTAENIVPNKDTAKNIPLRNAKFNNSDCPNGLECSFIPALYKQFSSSPTNYGNYDIANRPEDGIDIRYIVIHDIEGSAQSAINHFRNQSFVSAHYIIDSANGKVTQMVRPNDIPWHAGNWYFNMHSIGIEHEGFAVDGTNWYSEQMYRSTAKLVKYLSETYNIPLDRQHIIGHDEIPGLTVSKHAAMHWDPGAYWDWSHFFNLLGESLNPSKGDKNSSIVTIRPNFNTNKAGYTYSGKDLDSLSSSFLQLYKEPDFNSPLISDPVLNKTAPGTTRLNDWGAKATMGQSYVKADQQGDWTAIYFAGQKAWFYNPNNKNTVPGNGTVIKPKDGLSSIPVYGAAYPENSAYDGTGIAASARGVAEVLYQLPKGQMYAATGPIQSDYYHAKNFNDPATNKVVKGTEEFYQISFNHRIGFVKKSDVDVVVSPK
ncbi:N-acetylmuramoyl-L-alanine amidase [Bacillus sp. FJAT-29814]|uniref:N-acetylmuramoyl-L-alanine amidase n=1 Tax=Bacillus sp. FJAT-29814 TaxID=1729688 RepID=UPI00083268F9|nr:N-acetylmuramoyl-L-alanine amidase [Bacillus sp. FJAT-29814]